MKGGACDQAVEIGTSATLYKKKRSAEVWRLIGLAPTHIELAISRLRVFQRMLEEPMHHQHYLIAFF
eukprot:1189582-Heterocapsa_arctica.AAC.1